jgi:histone H1/5
MAPKKVASNKKAEAEHPPFKEMVEIAIVSLRERNGSSRQAIKKYILSNFTVKENASTTSNLNSAIKKGVEAGHFSQPKGSSGPVKLVKNEDAVPAATTKVTTKKVAGTTTLAKSKASSKSVKTKDDSAMVVDGEESPVVEPKSITTKAKGTKSAKSSPAKSKASPKSAKTKDDSAIVVDGEESPVVEPKSITTKAKGTKSAKSSPTKSKSSSKSAETEDDSSIVVDGEETPAVEPKSTTSKAKRTKPAKSTLTKTPKKAATKKAVASVKKSPAKSVASTPKSVHKSAARSTKKGGK